MKTEIKTYPVNQEGKPKKRVIDYAKQKKYQESYNRRQKAARKRLGITIAEWKKLPAATRLMELRYNDNRMAEFRERVKRTTAKIDAMIPLPTETLADKTERQRARQRAWYHRNKPIKKATVPSNGILPADDRSVKFCPHCGWNIDAMRKAQAFIDGRVA